jgi:dsDNA-specific endonuclease/ATPase MutS2
MKHNFKTGDRVLFINENDKGTILMFIGNTKVKLLNSAGFEEMVALNEIMSFPNDTHDIDAYGNFHPEEDNLEDLQQPEVNKFLQFSNDKISQLIFKADLHIENLVEHYTHLENFEIIQIQKNRCEDCIKESKNKGIPRLNLVHGVGKGTLKKAIHSLLKTHRLQFSDKYGFTEVIIS